MAVYLHSAASISACGNQVVANDLQFSSAMAQQVQFNQQDSALFFAMQGIQLSTEQSRILDNLLSLVKQLIIKSQLSREACAKTALILGSTSLDIGSIVPQTENTIWLTNTDFLSQYLQQQLSLNDFHLTINTACTASVNALLSAKKLIDNNSFEQVIVVGCEFYNTLTIAGFHSLDLISQSELATFSNQRDGLVLGEGIGAVLLSREKPQAQHYFEVLNGYSACDTYSLTMTQEDGVHIEQVINKALQLSKLTHADIDLIKVHGTATYNNDLAEFNAITRCFSTPPNILALKPFTGHTLGACGVLEISLLMYLLTKQTLPIPDYVNDGVLLPFAPAERALSEYQYLLLNHCGFGGNNAAIVLKRVTACNLN